MDQALSMLRDIPVKVLPLVSRREEVYSPPQIQVYVSRMRKRVVRGISSAAASIMKSVRVTGVQQELTYEVHGDVIADHAKLAMGGARGAGAADTDAIPEHYRAMQALEGTGAGAAAAGPKHRQFQSSPMLPCLKGSRKRRAARLLKDAEEAAASFDKQAAGHAEHGKGQRTFPRRYTGMGRSATRSVASQGCDDREGDHPSTSRSASLQGVTVGTGGLRTQRTDSSGEQGRHDRAVQDAGGPGIAREDEADAAVEEHMEAVDGGGEAQPKTTDDAVVRGWGVAGGLAGTMATGGVAPTMEVASGLQAYTHRPAIRSHGAGLRAVREATMETSGMLTSGSINTPGNGAHDGGSWVSSSIADSSSGGFHNNSAGKRVSKSSDSRSRHLSSTNSNSRSSGPLPRPSDAAAVRVLDDGKAGPGVADRSDSGQVIVPTEDQGGHGSSAKSRGAATGTAKPPPMSPLVEGMPSSEGLGLDVLDDDASNPKASSVGAPADGRPRLGWQTGMVGGSGQGSSRGTTQGTRDRMGGALGPASASGSEQLRDESLFRLHSGDAPTAVGLAEGGDGAGAGLRPTKAPGPKITSTSKAKAKAKDRRHGDTAGLQVSGGSVGASNGSSFSYYDEDEDTDDEENEGASNEDGRDPSRSLSSAMVDVPVDDWKSQVRQERARRRHRKRARQAAKREIHGRLGKGRARGRALMSVEKGQGEGGGGKGSGGSRGRGSGSGSGEGSGLNRQGGELKRRVSNTLLISRELAGDSDSESVGMALGYGRAIDRPGQGSSEYSGGGSMASMGSRGSSTSSRGLGDRAVHLKQGAGDAGNAMHKRGSSTESGFSWLGGGGAGPRAGASSGAATGGDPNGGGVVDRVTDMEDDDPDSRWANQRIQKAHETVDQFRPAEILVPDGEKLRPWVSFSMRGGSMGRAREPSAVSVATSYEGEEGEKEEDGGDSESGGSRYRRAVPGNKYDNDASRLVVLSPMFVVRTAGAVWPYLLRKGAFLARVKRFLGIQTLVAVRLERAQV